MPQGHWWSARRKLCCLQQPRHLAASPSFTLKPPAPGFPSPRCPFPRSCRACTCTSTDRPGGSSTQEDARTGERLEKPPGRGRLPKGCFSLMSLRWDSRHKARFEGKAELCRRQRHRTKCSASSGEVEKHLIGEAGSCRHRR